MLRLVGLRCNGRLFRRLFNRRCGRLRHGGFFHRRHGLGGFRRGLVDTGGRHGLARQGGYLLLDGSDVRHGSFGRRHDRGLDGLDGTGDPDRSFDLAVVPGTPEDEQRKGQHRGRGGGSHRDATEHDLATAALEPFADAFPDIRRRFGHPFEAIAQPLVKIISYHDITLLSFLATGSGHGSTGSGRTVR